MARLAVNGTGSDFNVPNTEQALRDLGQTGNALAAVLQALGQDSAARDVLGLVLPLQRRLAERRPDDVPTQYALIDTLLRLALLQLLHLPPATPGLRRSSRRWPSTSNCNNACLTTR